MDNTKRTHSKRVKNLVTVCALCAILLTVSTYAWFVGMKTVNVKPFEIKIATTEGLFLSMDGYKWSYNLDVTDETHFPAYEGNTNFWATDGLIPMSSVGDMDASVSRMKLYEKGSITTTKGGYRLLTSRVNNNELNATTTPENPDKYHQGKGYVVFDLFIKNLSGTKYYDGNEPLNEEAIYLQTNSKVAVGSLGADGTGIENSVRVAFTQIGRVEGTTADGATSATDEKINTITGITCSDATVNGVKVTGICRDAQIWEPNDTKHVANALNWYNTSCRKRKSTGSDVTLDASYDLTTDGKCPVLSETTAYPTYAISKPIEIIDNVDVYDGLTYNSYESSVTNYEDYVTAGKTGAKLVNFPYFTDTKKNIAGKERPKFMSLAPNSITKLRVYIYIEGQDIDNYDFASLGRQIAVNFGFTKERYNPEDVSYSGPELPVTSSL